MAMVSLEWTGTLVPSRNKALINKALGMLLSAEHSIVSQDNSRVQNPLSFLYEMLSAEEGSIYSGTPYMQSILIPCTDFSII